MRNFSCVALFLSVFVLASASLTFADPPQEDGSYRRSGISEARFRSGQAQELLTRAYTLEDMINGSVVGQGRIARALKERVVQYLENLGGRNKEPIVFNMIGLPGIGKSSILDVLERLGIDVIRVDAQAFTQANASGALSALASQLRNAEYRAQQGTPCILLFDELDKVAEIQSTGEVTQPLIGVLNQILTDGRASVSGSSFNLSNVLVVTAMNFSPTEIEAFSRDSLGADRNFYDFTTADFAAFDRWIRENPAAIPKVLSRLFRSNTVSRLAPNTMIAKPLSDEDYFQIIRNVTDATLSRLMQQRQGEKRIEASYSEAFLEFLRPLVVYAPSGARDTIIKTNALVEQLFNYGVKASDGDSASLTRPRKIRIDVDSGTGRVVLEITPQIWRNTALVDGDTFRVSVEYDADSRLFIQPEEISVSPPRLPSTTATQTQRRITRRDVVRARFPEGAETLNGIASRIDSRLFGQGEMTAQVERELSAYFARPGAVEKNPPFMILAGFPGIGKSELVYLAAREAQLPVARINMQAFSGDGGDTLASFIRSLADQIATAKHLSRNGKYIVLFEELDKVFEVNPQSGAFVNRPVMNFIKDLLNDGKVTYTTANGGDFEIDIRGAYSFVTMNFAVDRFGFVADPRLTSIDDVLRAWRRLRSRPADLKNVLGSMFLPETVSRMLPRTHVMRPLQLPDYLAVIAQQIEGTVRSRLVPPATRENPNPTSRAALQVTVSESYRSYLESESIIPSEGARQTVLVVQNRVTSDLDRAMRALPRTGQWAYRPVTIHLDYNARTETISALATITDGRRAPRPKKLFERPALLTFPPLAANGRMSHERLLTAAHEFGHAFAGVRLGARFEYATSVAPQSGIGGYVKFRQGNGSAMNLMVTIYYGLASRAMERIFLSPDALRSTSVLDITAGPSQDIKSATALLWQMSHLLGMNPGGGVMDRTGGQYANFESVPADQVESLGRILRGMEDYMVGEFMRAHTREWYVQAIERFARAGGTTEQEFYEIIGYLFPGNNALSFGERSALEETFAGSIQELPAELLAARNARQSETQTTAEENLRVARAHFEALLRRHLGSNPEAADVVCEAQMLPASASPTATE